MNSRGVNETRALRLVSATEEEEAEEIQFEMKFNSIQRLKGGGGGGGFF